MSPLQSAEKIRFRIRVSIQRYRKFLRISRPFRGWPSTSDFFRSPLRFEPSPAPEFGRTRRIKYHEFEMCILWLIPDRDAVIVRPINRVVQDKGLDFNRTEGPSPA